LASQSGMNPGEWKKWTQAFICNFHYLAKRLKKGGLQTGS
jgi:hypothetical protein